MVDVIDDKYEVVAELGHGVAGAEYKVRHTLLDTTLALTVLPARVTADADLRARVMRAMREASELRHEHIAAVRDFGCSGNRYHVVEAFLPETTTLEELLRGSGALPPSDALQIARQLADALAYAHERSITHGAITPACVHVAMGTPPRATLSGFGLVELARGHAFTTAYAAPERLTAGDVTGRLDPRADIFALGLLLFEMLEGTAFFAGRTEAEITHALVHATEPLLPRFSRIHPAGVPALVARALRRTPAERHRTMTQLRRELDACLCRLGTNRLASAVAEDEVVAAPVETAVAGSVVAVAPQVIDEDEDLLPPAATVEPPPVEKRSLAEKVAVDPSEPITGERIVAKKLLLAAGRMPVERRKIPVGAVGLGLAVLLVIGCYVLGPQHHEPESAAASVETEVVAPAAPPVPPMAEAPAPVVPAAVVVAPLPAAPVADPPQVAANAPETAPVVSDGVDDEAPAGATIEPRRPEKNLPPQIVSARPRRGEVVSVTEGQSVDFSVRATDRNTDDRLAYTWFLDGRRVSQKPSWRFVAPLAATGATHSVEVQVRDAAGLAAPRVAWNVDVAPRMSEFDVREWLGRLVSARERKDVAMLRLYGVVTSDVAAQAAKKDLARLGDVRSTIANESIHITGRYATVSFDRTEVDRRGTVVASARESYELEKRADGFVALRSR